MLDSVKHQNERVNIFKVIAELGAILGKKADPEGGKKIDEKFPDNLIKGEVFSFKKGDGFISDHVIKVIQLLDENKIEGDGGAVIQSLLLRSLLRDLIDLKKGEKSIFEKIVKKISNCPPAQYIGYRMEVLTAAILTTKDIKFTMPDPPDFLIPYNGSSVKIECGSRYINKPKDIDALLKAMLDPMVKKNSYDNSTAIFLDSTNVVFNGRFWKDTDYFETKKVCQEAMDKSKFGALFLFNWLIDSDKGVYNCFPNHVYSSSISDNLKMFLDSYFPISKEVQWIKNARVANRG